GHEPLDELMRSWFDGLNPILLDEHPLSYRCDCSRPRMEKALIALGRQELTAMIQEEKDGAELTCHFCKRRERFTQADLLKLLNKAAER
ncbi:MAG: Hsp33 family molecular chaperone HslO, partial [Clostridia bacterium]